MIYGRIKSFEAKLNSYINGKDKTVTDFLTLQKEAKSLATLIKLGGLKTDAEILEKLKGLVEIRNTTVNNFDPLAQEYYAILDNLLKYGTGYRTKTTEELSGKMSLAYKKYDEYLEQTKLELTRPLIAYKKTYGITLEHGIKLSSYYTKNKGKTDLIPPHIAEKLKKTEGMETK